MGAIRVVAPDGQVGEIPEEQAAGAFAAGFKPAPDAPAMPAMATPGAVPVRPTAPEPMVSVLAPDGQAGEVPQSQLAGALSAGFTRPPQEAPGGAAAALAEGIAQGASLGSQTPLAAVEGAGAWLGNKAFELTQPDAPKIPIGQSYQEAQRSITQREDEHPIASGIGQTIGIIAPALATSGASLAGTAVVGGATGLLARGATAVAAKVAAKVSATAARGLLAPATRLLAQGAIEGAAFGAAKEVDDAFIAGDYDSLAEKVAWSTARGVGIGAGMSLAGGALFASAAKVVNAAISGGRKLAEESAYKAVVGRTNQAASRSRGRSPSVSARTS